MVVAAINVSTYYGSMLRYASVAVNLSLSTQELNYVKGFPVMDSWESFVNREVMDIWILSSSDNHVSCMKEW